MIEYNRNQSITHEALLNLYESVGWSAYTKDNTDLTSLLKGARHYLAAWDDDRLIGLIRVVGDGVYIAYIQDILVHPDYHRQGIGRQLMEQMLNEISYAKQIILTTEDTPKTKAFYQTMGMDAFTDLGTLGFSKNDN
ncbi:GNAT family N-acetyltransferase [Aerococcaceae bacterium DSM 111021]|nr:GNAT family N-acetyltransferase [Aerococcaceae bacterium DSM 111021]